MLVVQDYQTLPRASSGNVPNPLFLVPALLRLPAFQTGHTRRLRDNHVVGLRALD
jgi:hypothetical protein